MLVKDFCDELYNHIFSILDGECVHSSPCGVGGDRAAEIATKVSELVRDMLNEDDAKPERKSDGIGEYYDRIEKRRQAANAELVTARIRNADAKTIRKLEEKAHWAGYTGD